MPQAFPLKKRGCCRLCPLLDIFGILMALQSNLCMQAGQDETGTPSHRIVAVTHSNKTGSAGKSIGREVGWVKQTLSSLSIWREGIDQQMSENWRDMAFVNMKLDLLLQAIIPSTASHGTELDVCHDGKGISATKEAEFVRDEHTPEQADVITLTQAGQEKACSASLMSVRLGGEFPDSTIPGKILLLRSFKDIIYIAC